MHKFLLLLSALFYFSYAGAQPVALTSSDLPIIIIDTHGKGIVDDPKIVADMKIIYNGEGKRNNATDPANTYNGNIAIEVHGNSSQAFPMKSYGIELDDEKGNSIDMPLFGMPEQSDWILYAPYTDKTLMRNVLAYNLSNKLGHWASHTKYVEVIVNGEYKGIYVFEEQIRRDKGRVDISKIKSSSNSGDVLTGGYIIRIDKGAQGWYSPHSPIFKYDYYYPKLKNITDQQKTYIESYVDSFENAVASTQFQDTVNGMRRYADISSFIDYFIINEVSRNVDGYRLSTYMHKDIDSKGGKLIAGPVWDYDLAFRNVNYCHGADTTGWAYQFNKVCNTDPYHVPFWWNRFFDDSLFKSSLLCRWRALRQSVLSMDNINHLIDSVTRVVKEASVRHFQQWPVLGQYVWPNPDPIPASYPEEISTLKNWISQRLTWIDHNLPIVGPCSVPIVIPDKLSVAVYPNPVHTSSTIIINSPEDQTLIQSLYNAGGAKVQTIKQSLRAGVNRFILNLSNEPAGVYILKMTGGNKIKVLKKIVKE